MEETDKWARVGELNVINELIINITQSNWYMLCGGVCDNSRFVFNIVLITYIPALKLDLFPWKTHCVQIHGTTNIVQWIHLNCARVNYLDHQSNVAGCELFRMKGQWNYHHQSKITGLRSALSCIKAATNHTFCFDEMPILCWNPSLWCPSTHLWRTKLTFS